MKNIIRNTLAMTGLALTILCIVALIYQGRFLCIETVFQVLFACVVIQIVLILLKHFESEYILVEVVVEIGCVLAVLFLAGYFFHWFVSIPGWVLAVIGILVYAIGCIIDMFQIKRDVNQINDIIRKRKEQMNH